MADSQDPETLLLLLKDKAKEIKALKKKVKKVEEKYVEMFKSNKMISIDRENLVKLLVESYSDPEVKHKLTIEDLGSYNYDDLKPILEEAKEKEHNFMKQMSDADLIPDMQRQIDVYKAEFQNFNDQINKHKNESLAKDTQILELTQQIKDREGDLKKEK